MKIELIAAWESNYSNTKKSKLLAFPTLINLAALTPKENISVTYEQSKDVNFNIDADLIGISYITPFANRAFKIADTFREQGRTVVLGGPDVTLFPNESEKHADALFLGEAEYSWLRLIEDFKRNKLKKRYYGETLPNLSNLPPPRFDLIYNDFFLSQAITVTRGCPFSCNFCLMKSVTPGFRVRPIKDVIRDIKLHEGKSWLQNKVIWFWDDNLIGDINYAKELFIALKPLKKWWIAQVTSNIAADDQLLKLAADSGCIALYIGFESFNQKSLKDVNKFHNQVNKYEKIVKKIHNYGIAVSSGLIVGFDFDTENIFNDSIKSMNSIGIDWVNANIIVPFQGTPLYDKLKEENRILTENKYYYNGSTAVFKPKLIGEKELNDGFHQMVKNIYSLKNILIRFKKFYSDVPKSRIGAYLIFLFGNFLFNYLRRKPRPIKEKITNTVIMNVKSYKHTDEKSILVDINDG